jgi:hypothetical protein
VIEPEDRWEPHRVSVCLTAGPERIYDDDPTPDLARRPVGFVPVSTEIEPLVWEGDQA